MGGDVGAANEGVGESAWGPRREPGRALRVGFVLDVASYSARPVPDRDVIQDRLRDLVVTALGRCGLALGAPDVSEQWTGDGVNVLLPPHIDPPAVLSVLIRSLAAALRADNARHGDRIRLRMAVGVGLAVPTAAGFGGPMIVNISRLVDSAALRRALRDHAAADLAVALSDLAYALIIQPGYPGIPAGQFTQAAAVAKEFSGTAWLWTAARQWSEPAYLPLGPADPPEVGGYRIAARLGWPGEDATVYLASGHDSHPDPAGAGWVALKVIGQRLAGDQDARRRLPVGVLSARVVRAPGVATVVASGELPRDAPGEPGQPWVASTLVRGPSLAATVAETGPLPGDAVAWLTLDLARILAALHRAGFAHQSVSPRNVLLEAGGAALTDFGVSRGALVNGPPGNGAADVRMLGATAYFALTGYSAWTAAPGTRKQDGTLEVHGTLELDAPHGLGLTGCPAWLAPVILSCLAADPGQRPAAAQVQARLAAAIGPRPQSWLPHPVAARITECQDHGAPGSRGARASAAAREGTPGHR